MSTKFFVGYSLTLELKSHASASGLTTTPHQGKEYLGLYLDHPMPTLAEVRNLAEKIKKALPIPHRGKLHVFPQLFVG